jgi:hypothetical protein
MKKFVTVLFTLLSLVPYLSNAQIKLPAILAGNKSNGTVSESEAGVGIKEALLQGVTSAVLNLNKTDGFFGNQLYKVLLPEDAKKVEKTLRNVGMGSQVDKAILAINRGAEDAVAFAKPIFINAVKEMTLADALTIIKGNKNAATEYFKTKTKEQLISAFTPSVKTSLDKVDATKYYTDIITTYNKLPTTFKKADPNLTHYVVGKTVDALFDQIAKEEANIRVNPLARTNDILKKVFGGK